jgi:hypothetical protein
MNPRTFATIAADVRKGDIVRLAGSTNQPFKVMDVLNVALYPPLGNDDSDDRVISAVCWKVRVEMTGDEHHAVLDPAAQVWITLTDAES